MTHRLSSSSLGASRTEPMNPSAATSWRNSHVLGRGQGPCVGAPYRLERFRGCLHLFSLFNRMLKIIFFFPQKSFLLGMENNHRAIHVASALKSLRCLQKPWVTRHSCCAENVLITITVRSTHHTQDISTYLTCPWAESTRFFFLA